ncbi:MAG: DUF2628 domain-containing protein, partial [Holosporaceae bacterium]|nr:DUF2628 domain-containing protein [Holosporaceae bacterium]
SLWGLVASHSRRFNLNEKTLNDYQKSIRPHVSCNKEALSRNDSYYLWILNKINSGKVISFNFAAFFVGVFWFAYRKMYLEAAILYLISVVFNVTMLIFPDGLILKTCFLIYCIAPIFLANFLYYKYIERKINKPAGNSPVMKKTGIILFLASIFLFALFATYRHGLLGSISALDIIFLSCPHVLMLIIMLILYYRDKRQSTASNAESHH